MPAARDRASTPECPAGRPQTVDLFHAMVAKSITYRASVLKTRDLHEGGLDLIWTPCALPCWPGPQQVQLPTSWLRPDLAWYSTCVAHPRGRIRLADSSSRTKKRVFSYSRSPVATETQSSVWFRRRAGRGGPIGISDRRKNWREPVASCVASLSKVLRACQPCGR